MKVGLSQHSPIFLNLERSLEKAKAIMEEASELGCQLLVFGESWLSGYPVWLDHAPNIAKWDHAPTKEIFLRMHQNSITIPGPEISKLQDYSKKLKLAICMGLNEKVESNKGHGTLYNSLVLIDEAGNLIHHHRKLMPTFTEKMLYGLGDGRGIDTVSINGWNVGGLICWEHWMPLSRQALHDKGEQLHISLWPQVHEMHQIASRHYAFEGRCFVLAVGQIMTAGQMPEVLEFPRSDSNDLLLNGGSCVIGPDGKFLTAPVFGQECIVTAELEMSNIQKEQMTLDVSGHYSRPDIYEFHLKKYSSQ